VQEVCVSAITRGLARSAHDCSDGGLAVALAECCLSGRDGARGARIRLDEVPIAGESATAPPARLRLDALLFAESPSRIILSASPGDVPAIMDLAQARGVPAAVIGVVTASGGLTLRAGEATLTVDQAAMERAHRGSFPGIMS
jgi:phosphoribosylformylglycinamidine (FGAM) synthase-like enzyme